MRESCGALKYTGHKCGCWPVTLPRPPFSVGVLNALVWVFFFCGQKKIVDLFLTVWMKWHWNELGLKTVKLLSLTFCNLFQGLLHHCFVSLLGHLMTFLNRSKLYSPGVWDLAKSKEFAFAFLGGARISGCGGSEVASECPCGGRWIEVNCKTRICCFRRASN